MRPLYLIFSHDNIEQLKRLVGTIRKLSPHSMIGIHHDPTQSTVDAFLFADIDNVYVVPEPVKGEWGDYSQVEQFLHAIRWCNTNIEFDWLITLSGLSYPIKQLSDFEYYLQNSECDAYVRHFDAYDPVEWPVGTAKTRFHFTYYKLPKFGHYYKIPGAIKTLLTRLRRWLNEHQSLFRFMPMPRGGKTRLGLRRLRVRPVTIKHFSLRGGRNILNLNKKSVSRMLDFEKNHPEFKIFLKRTICPDESYFTSIFANDAALRVCDNVLRYIKWPPNHAASVAVITHEEVNEVLRSAEPFALKFDIRVDPLALDYVDAFLGLCEDKPTTA